MLKWIENRKVLVVVFVLLIGIVSVFLFPSLYTIEGTPHTHIHFKDLNVHVWSYLKVKEVTIGHNSIEVDSHINAEINEAVEVKFQNGSKTKNAGKISINNKVIQLERNRVNHILLKRNGFEKGVYIRTFDRRYIWPINMLE